MRYRKWRAERKRGEKRDITAPGKKINIPDISRSGGEARNEPRNDSRFVKRRCIIQADIKGRTQLSAMMGGDGKPACVCGRRGGGVQCLGKKYR